MSEVVEYYNYISSSIDDD